LYYREWRPLFQVTNAAWDGRLIDFRVSAIDAHASYIAVIDTISGNHCPVAMRQ